jgi:hypothetical protein
MQCTIDRSIQTCARSALRVRASASTPREPANQPKSAIVRIIAVAINLLVPHIAQNTSTLRNRLLLPARSASSGVVVGWAALHLCNLAELGGVGLLVQRQQRFEHKPDSLV